MTMAELEEATITASVQGALSEQDTTSIENLRQRIKTVIVPWQESIATKPPFTGEQLIVMAMILSDSPLTEEAVFLWIVETFRHYKELVIFDLWKERSWRHHENRSGSFTKDLKAIFARSDNHFVSHAGKKREVWTISADDAATYLKSIIGDDDIKNVKPVNQSFFDLPFELRDIIYKMVFRYDGPGVTAGKKPYTSSAAGKRVLYLWDQSYNEPLDLNAWEADDGWYGFPNRPVVKKPISEILAPLVLCRQFYNEAMPVFYSNNFYFKGLRDLSWFLEYTTLERRNHITSVTVTFLDEEQDVAGSALKRLAQIQSLRRLNFRINERWWTASSHGGTVKKYSDVTRLAGLPTMGRMRGLTEVNFCGPCPTIESAYKANMLEPKKAKIATGGKRKRKDEGEEGQTLVGKKGKTKAT